jgi:hypothetical protein
MKIIRTIHGKTIRDKIRGDQLQQLSGIQDIVKWGQMSEEESGMFRGTEWRDNRLAKID